jgi:hypothetical protein
MGIVRAVAGAVRAMSGAVRGWVDGWVGICGGDAWFATYVFVVGLGCVAIIGGLIAADYEYRKGGGK